MESNDRRTSSSKSHILSFSPRKGRRERERERIPREVAMFSEGGGVEINRGRTNALSKENANASINPKLEQRTCLFFPFFRELRK